MGCDKNVNQQLGRVACALLAAAAAFKSKMTKSASVSLGGATKLMLQHPAPTEAACFPMKCCP